MLCPSNSLRASEKVNDMNISQPGTSSTSELATDKTVTDRKKSFIRSKYFKYYVFKAKGSTGITVYDPAVDNPTVAATPWATQLDMVVEAISQGGINTNYAQSWFAARGNAKVVPVGTAPNIVLYPANGQKHLRGGFAGLPSRLIEKGVVPSSAVAILGDASPGDSDEAVSNGAFTTDCPAGSRLVESFNDGPSFVTPNGNILTSDAQNLGGPFPILSIATSANNLPLKGEIGPGGSNVHLQDTRDFGTVHGSGTQKSVNILFADGSVKTIYDVNGDGYINPGFFGPFDETTASTDGFTENECEVDPAENVERSLSQLRCDCQGHL